MSTPQPKPVQCPRESHVTYEHSQQYQPPAVTPLAQPQPMAGGHGHYLATHGGGPVPMAMTGQPPTKRFCPAPVMAHGKGLAGGGGMEERQEGATGLEDDIVGSRVFARGHAGAMFPGIIKALRYCGSTSVLYCIEYGDGSTAEVHGRDIIGEGFRQLAHSRLGPGMAVYVTYNQMLCAGHVRAVHEKKAQVVVELEGGDRIRCSEEDVQTECLGPGGCSGSVTSAHPLPFPPSHDMATSAQPSHRLPAGTGHAFGGPYGAQPQWAPSSYSRTDSGVSSAGHVSPGLPLAECHEGSMDSTVTSMTMTYPTPPLPPAAWATPDGHLAVPGPMAMAHSGAGRGGGSAKAIFRCLFPHCGHFLATTTGMRRHVRQCHLGGDQPVPNMVVDRYIAQVLASGPGPSPSLSGWQWGVPGSGSTSDALKCRKRYGSDKKELWCIKCRWKKACERVAPGKALQ